MNGTLVPLVMVPRYTGYLGANTFSTLPLDVSAYRKATLEYWRGELAGSQLTTPATWTAHFEEASEPDPIAWTALVTALTTVNTTSLVELEFQRKYFRVRFVATAGSGGGASGLVAITVFVAGNLERRVP
jgi:hypothetical protein